MARSQPERGHQPLVQNQWLSIRWCLSSCLYKAEHPAGDRSESGRKRSSQRFLIAVENTGQLAYGTLITIMQRLDFTLDEGYQVIDMIALKIQIVYLCFLTFISCCLGLEASLFCIFFY